MLDPLKCTQCCASIEIINGMPSMFCAYCGTAFVYIPPTPPPRPQKQPRQQGELGIKINRVINKIVDNIEEALNK